MTTAVVALALDQAQADYQFNSGDDLFWQRVAMCNDATDENGLDYSLHTVMSMARRATQVRFCSAGSTDDCTTSRTGTFPIVNLRQGIRMMSHIDATTPCTELGCMGQTWIGPPQRLSQMIVRAGPHEHCTPGGVPGAGKFNTSMAYWACGNPGLHFSLNPGGACFWAPSERGEGLEMFINSGHSASPTMSPTSSPSNWFQHAGHLTNWTTAQDRITALEQTVGRLEAERATYATVAALQQAQADARTENGASVSALRYDVVSAIEAVNATVTSLRSAILAAVAASSTTPRVTPGSIPQIGAIGPDLVLRSPSGSVTVESGSCNPFDLCELNAFAERLSARLSAV